MCDSIRNSSSSSVVSDLDPIWSIPELNAEPDECKDHSSQVNILKLNDKVIEINQHNFLLEYFRL